MNQSGKLMKLKESVRLLKVEYEKYFAGIEKRSPHQQHEELKREFRRVQSELSNRTADKFMFQQCQASLSTHERQWGRICQRIEEGTYKRPRVNRASMPSPQKPRAPAQPTADKALDDLHQSYIDAQRQVGGGRRVTKEVLAKTIRRQTQALKERYNCDSVNFKVKVNEGKVVLKAVIPKAKTGSESDG